MPRILWLDEIHERFDRAHDAPDALDALLGGKAWGLARLLSVGVRVSRGFVVVDANAKCLPAELEQAVDALGSGSLAVRSSALGEDASDASFAGQYVTRLGVTGIEEVIAAIQECVSSLRNDSADAYGHAVVGERTENRMSVVVQCMVDAKMAGVNGMERLYEAYARHLWVSSGAGSIAPIFLSILARGGEPAETHHAFFAELLAGANDVESADIAEGMTRIVDVMLRDLSFEARQHFVSMTPADARVWLESEESSRAGCEYQSYLAKHGHRSVRELDVRQPEWSEDPTPVISAL